MLFRYTVRFIDEYTDERCRLESLVSAYEEYIDHLFNQKQSVITLLVV